MKYGVFIGRFQPFHIGHEAIVHEIISDDRIPVIMVGSANVTNDRNPFSISDRLNMIGMVFSYARIFGITDNDSWDKWWETISSWLPNVPKEAITFYINHKESDRCDFEFNGKQYKNEFWSAIVEDQGYATKHVTYPKLLNININASDIRKDLEGNKHYLDSRVYNYIKGIDKLPLDMV